MMGYLLQRTKYIQGIRANVYRRPCICDNCKTRWTQDELVYGGTPKEVRVFDACDNCYDPKTREFKE